jgi:protein-S-isoprenylcysteine O-methyltransferase Ste14
MNKSKEAHHPGHIFHIVLPIIFLVIWILDSFVFRYSTMLADYIPLALRIVLCFGVLICAFILWGAAHKALFGALFNPPRHTPNGLVTTGVFAFLRHPMYLGNLLALLSGFLLTWSLMTLGCWIVVFIIFNNQAAREDKSLEETYGEKYRNYRTSVSRWLPSLSRYQTE